MSFYQQALASAQTKQWDARYTNQPVPHDNSFYAKCMLAGVVSCGLTHTLITPLDVAKCNIQVNPAKYTGLVSALKTINAEQGMTGLLKGWLPTAIGYSAQGAFKFGLYEFFKDFYANLAGEEAANKYKALIYVAGSASAEFFADMALCPMEMVKVKVQTSPAGTFPTAFGEAMAKMNANKAEFRFPFGSLVPLWTRQIPYTVAKFVCFEKCVEMFYTHVFTQPKESYSAAQQLAVVFASGYIAGVVCAVVSHPADSLVSLAGKEANKGKSFGQIANEVGAMSLCTKGLSTRVLMIGTLTGLQWWIYSAAKVALGLVPAKA